MDLPIYPGISAASSAARSWAGVGAEPGADSSAANPARCGRLGIGFGGDHESGGTGSPARSSSPRFAALPPTAGMSAAPKSANGATDTGRGMALVPMFFPPGTKYSAFALGGGSRTGCLPPCRVPVVFPAAPVSPHGSFLVPAGETSCSLTVVCETARRQCSLGPSGVSWCVQLAGLVPAGNGCAPRWLPPAARDAVTRTWTRSWGCSSLQDNPVRIQQVLAQVPRKCTRSKVAGDEFGGG